MHKRFVCIWFRYLLTDWFTIRRPALQKLPFVIVTPDHGRMVITSANPRAEAESVEKGMVLADARAIIPSLEVIDNKIGLAEKLLSKLAEWFIRYSPFVAVDPTGGLILDASGCAHLWGGEEAYVKDIISRLSKAGYHIRVGMADTIGAAWAVSRYGNNPIIQPDQQSQALLLFTPAALRIEDEILERLFKLGLRQIKDFIAMPRSAIRRRFGMAFIKRLDQALGSAEEIIEPVQPIEAYHERLPCIEPIATATGIEIGLQQLLQVLCSRLKNESKGLRIAVFKGYRIDGKIETIEIGTNRATHNEKHLYKLFEIKLSSIEPGLGIELFILEAKKVEDVVAVQEQLWESIGGLHDINLSELIDRLSGRVGAGTIHRYIPGEHYWPERSMKSATSLHENISASWRNDKPRPIQLLTKPERIEVAAPIPDYPPMHFRYKNKLHKVVKADGPERIEQEWWIQQGQHRDYYCVEDEEGHRYWLFRSGHYTGDKTHQWFIHGFFA